MATAEDLIVMKVLAFRGKDIADIESILDANPKLDLRRIRHWNRMMAAGLDEPEVAERFEELLRRRSNSGVKRDTRSKGTTGKKPRRR